MMRIALLEDDPLVVQLMQRWLREAGHEVVVFTEGRRLMRELSFESFDLAVLDWMLPDVEGIEVLRWLREQIHWQLPVLFATGRDEEADVVAALEAGADDYMIKPLRQRELLARITALQRRTVPLVANNPWSYPPYRFDPQTSTVFIDDEPVELTHREFELALFLFRANGRVLSRNHLLESVWGINQHLNTRTVDTHISRLRNKLQIKPERGWQLRAVYQHGYRLDSAAPRTDSE